MSDVLVARTQGKIPGVFRAVIPPEGYSGQDMDTITLFSGSDPLAIKGSDTKARLRELLTIAPSTGKTKRFW